MVAAAVAHRMRRRPVFFMAFLLAGPSRFLILAVFAVGGFAGGFLNPSGYRGTCWAGSMR